ncbi:MAG: ribosome biogenesis GTPase YlqF [Bacilli bacterium]
MNINWFPGHMAKTQKELIERLKVIDLVFEVIDARIPFSSKINDINKLIKNKPKLLLMTKIDMCDLNETNKWIAYYEKMGYKVLGLDLKKNININKIIKLIDDLMIEHKLKRQQKGLLKRKYRAIVLGIPNVGKSTLINRLVGKKATSVGNRPGVTKNYGWVRINDNLELLDSPGILWPKLDEEIITLNLAAMNAIKETIIPIDSVGRYVLEMLIKYYPNSLMTRYDINDTNQDIDTIIELIGRKRGALIHNEVDYDKVYNIILKDLKDGYFGGVTFDRYVSV